MRKMFFVLAFMLIGSFGFATTGALTVFNESSAISKVELKAEDGWACCSVSRNGGNATVCRSDGNVRKVCRQARRYTRPKR